MVAAAAAAVPPTKVLLRITIMFLDPLVGPLFSPAAHPAINIAEEKPVGGANDGIQRIGSDGTLEISGA